MSETKSRPSSLSAAAARSLQEHAAAACVALPLLLLLLPWWAVCAGSALYLTAALAPLLEAWRPRPRVSPKGKAVVITGCDSGFGHALALRLTGSGLRVFAGVLRPEGEGASGLRAAGVRVLALDVTEDGSVAEAAAAVERELADDQLWCVVNNAGLNEGGELLWTNMDSIRKVMEVNTFGVVRTTKAFLPLLCRHRGRVVAVASAAGRYSYPGMVPYCMSKMAVVGFCEGLRLEMYRFGVQVVTVEPWMYRTPITNPDAVLEYVTRAWDSAPAEAKALLPADYLERHQRATLRFLNLSISDRPREVVDCLEEAVLAAEPRYAYGPGTLYSRLTSWLLRRLPKPMADLLIHDECATRI